MNETKNKSRAIAIPMRWKLFASTALVSLVAAIIAIAGLSRMQMINDRMNQIVDVASAKSKLASLMKQELVAITRAEASMILAKSEEEVERHTATIDKTLDELLKNEGRLREIVADETRGRLDQFHAKWQLWQLNHAELRDLTYLNSDVLARNLSVVDARQQVDEVDKQLAAIAEAAQSESVSAIVAELRIAVLQMQRIEKNLILASNAQAIEEFGDRIRPLENAASEALARLQQLLDGDYQAQLDSASKAAHQYVLYTQKIRDYMGESGDFLVFQLAYGVGGPLADEAERLLDAIVERSEAEINTLQSTSQLAYTQARSGLIVLSVLGIAASLLLSFLVGDRMTRKLGKLATYASEIHDARDLSRPIPVSGNDEVGRVAEALDRMRQTVYLQTEQLASLNAALLDKSQEMEQFVYTVSHDLKSPLVSCKGMLGLMKEDLADEAYAEVGDSVKRMESATNQLSQIIDDLLELSRIGRKPLERTQVDVRELLEKLADGLRKRLEDSGVELKIASKLPMAWADASDLRRVFENLITNAVKYAGDVSEPTIEVGGMTCSQGVRFYVADNGPGIEPDYQEKIFGLFQRLDTRKEGTGLGLASVSKIARMHGGRAWVESEPNQGATFWIELPTNPNAVR